MAPEEPTHYPKRGAPSILDLYLLKNINVHCEVSSISALSSDHNPFELLVNESPQIEEPCV